MYCKICGEELTENSKICPNCGAELKQNISDNEKAEDGNNDSPTSSTANKEDVNEKIEGKNCPNCVSTNIKVIKIKLILSLTWFVSILLISVPYIGKYIFISVSALVIYVLYSDKILLKCNDCSKLWISSYKKSTSKIITKIGKALLTTFLIVLIIGVLFSSGSVDVKRQIDLARENTEEENYEAALDKYEQALSNWDEEDNYPFSKEKIQNEYKNTQINKQISTIGQKNWVVTFDDIIYKPVIDNNENIYIASNKRVLTAFDQSGSKKWEFKTNKTEEGFSPPIVTEDRIFLTGGNKLFALNKNGDQIWNYEFINVDNIFNPAISKNGMIYLGSDSYIYALNPNGDKIWQFKTGDTVTTLKIKDNLIYAGSFDNNFYALDKNGNKQWSYQADDSIYSFAVDKKNIYFGSNNKLYALNKKGKEEWIYEFKNNISIFNITVDNNGVIYLADDSYINENNTLYAISPTGDKKWSYHSQKESNISDPVVTVNGSIYFLSREGGHTKINIVNSDRTRMWSTQLETKANQPVLDKDNNIYFRSEENEKWKLYSLQGIPTTINQQFWASFDKEFQLKVKSNLSDTLLEKFIDHKSRTFKENSLVKLTVKPDQPYAFRKWEGDVFNSEEAKTMIRIDHNKEIKAVFDKYEGGNGTEKDPYLIKSAKQLDSIRFHLDCSFKQIADIDMSKYDWESIGDFTNIYQNKIYRGVFDGNSYEIKNIDPLQFGLFGRIDDTIKNVRIVNSYTASIDNGNSGILVGINDGIIINSKVNSDLKISDRRVGGIVGSNNGEIINCSFEGKIDGGKSYIGGIAGANEGLIKDSVVEGNLSISGSTIGGIVGHNKKGSIINSKYTGDMIDNKNNKGRSNNIGGISGINDNGKIELSVVKSKIVSEGSFIGGLVGQNNKGNITNTKTDVFIEGYKHIGGLVGINDKGFIDNSSVSGKIRGYEEVGGLVGFNKEGIIKKSKTNIDIVSDNGDTGGLIGYNFKGSVEKASSIGNLKDFNDSIGGLIGFNRESEVNKCFVDIKINGNEDVGGLVGTNAASLIKNSYAKGKIKGSIYVGGLVGVNTGEINKTYAAVEIVGNKSIGGLIGNDMKEFSLVENSYWDINKSNQTYSDGGRGKTTKEMFERRTYFAWDFNNIWMIQEEQTYPYLQWESR